MVRRSTRVLGVKVRERREVVDGGMQHGKLQGGKEGEWRRVLWQYKKRKTKTAMQEVALSL